MKSLYAFAFTSAVLATTTSTTMANTDTHKLMQNDCVSVIQGIAQYDINPFTDSKRVTCHDRIRYPSINSENKAASKTANQQGMQLNEPVLLTKPISGF